MILSLVLMLQSTALAPDVATAARTAPVAALTMKDVTLHRAKWPFEDYYPDRSQRLGLSGSAHVTCKVVQDGRLEGCVVIATAPEDGQFDMASLKIFEDCKIDTTTQSGEPTAGRTLDVTVRFTTGSRSGDEVRFE